MRGYTLKGSYVNLCHATVLLINTAHKHAPQNLCGLMAALACCLKTHLLEPRQDHARTATICDAVLLRSMFKR